MKKIFKIFLLTLFVFLAVTMFSNVFAVHNSPNDKINVYSYYGSKEINYYELGYYLDQGWSVTPVKQLRQYPNSPKSSKIAVFQRCRS